ncbi:MAG TPA: AMP-binding protein [Steroidobacteraceae bacterium]|nr:AMP-binding protein [Steroidobacteraceae bacterium]
MEIESLLGETLRCTPSRIALDDGVLTLTYRQLAEAVTSEARFLRAAGGTRFALLAENGAGWVIADLALHHLRQVNVPLPAFFTPPQQRHALDDAAIDVLVTDRKEHVLERWPEFRLLGRSPFSGLHVLQRAVAADARRAVAPGVVKITYTSGSTGEPKGVCLTAATLNCVSRSIATAVAGLGVTRHLCLMPLATLLENIAGVHASLRAGAGCVLPSRARTGIDYGALDPQKLLGTILRVRPDSLILVPELLRVLVRAVQAGHALPSSLKFVAVGGAMVSRELLAEATQLGLPVFEGYGLSECASVACLNTPGSSRLGSVGRPLPHVRIRVDEEGQIRVRGAVMSGYLGDPVRQEPLEIATGDLGEIDSDGYVYVRGRLKNVFITSLGRNISPEWVERELAHEPEIRHALAHGEARPSVGALLSPWQPSLDDAAIEHAVRRANARLPGYAQVRHWACMPEAPTFANGLLTANGRLRRERVLERFGGLLQSAS